jgi:hypothetical protein
MPRSLHEQPERNATAIEPVDPCDVGSQVAPDEDRTSAACQRGVQCIEATHLESIEDDLVRLMIERVVAREEPGHICLEGRLGFFDRPDCIESEGGILQCGADPLAGPRAQRHEHNAQESEYGIAADGAQPPQHGQCDVVEEEFPAQDSTEGSRQGTAPFAGNHRVI